MSLNADAIALKREAKIFVGHLNDVVSNVFPGRHLKFRLTAGTSGKGKANSNVSVEIRAPKNLSRTNAILLRQKSNNQLQPYIRATFKCRWSSDGQFLAIFESKFALYIKGPSSNPLFRYEYEIKRNSDMPNAHIQIHAHRDEVVWLKSKSKKRANSDDLPIFSQIHFPVGGDRFRPCFEDFLAFVIEEFGIKTKPNYRKILNAGRVEWREKQLKAAVRDNPYAAIDALRDLNLWGIDIENIRRVKRISKLEKI